MATRFELGSSLCLMLLGAASCGGPPKPVTGPLEPTPVTSASASADPSAPATTTATQGSQGKRPGQGEAAAGPKNGGRGSTGLHKATTGQTTIVPCTPGTPDHDRASRAFEQLDSQIDALAPKADQEPASKALLALLGQPCYRLAKLERPTSLDADSALALKTFWDSGGRQWLEHYLKLGAPPAAGQVQRSVVAPTMPKTLTKESSPNHRLRSQLCSSDDLACGRATRGWRQRAEHAFEAFARQRRLRWAAHDPKGSAIQSEQSCSRLAKALPEAERYASWRECIESLQLRVAALPLGGIAAPDAGWLLIRGRRGHYSFCDELRAYDLATGAAYVARSCGRLALGHTGRVDPATTDAARRLESYAGRVVVDNLREAAWSILLTADVQAPAIRQGAAIAIPSHVTVGRPSGRPVRGAPQDLGKSSNQTRLAWSYLRRGRVIHHGTLMWPTSYDAAAKDHAAKLLHVAEQGLEPGCPPAALPTKLDFGKGRPAVSPVDASRKTLIALHDELLDALQGLRKQRICRRQK